MVLDPRRWLGLRRFRGLCESGAVSLSEVAEETGLNRRTVRKYLSAQAPVAPPRRSTQGSPRRRVIDEVAPLVDAMLRAEILIKGAVVQERLVQEYGFTGNYQRVKLNVDAVAKAVRLTPPLGADHFVVVEVLLERRRWWMCWFLNFLLVGDRCSPLRWHFPYECSPP